jgi:hypothetical protein
MVVYLAKALQFKNRISTPLKVWQYNTNAIGFSQSIAINKLTQTI